MAGWPAIYLYQRSQSGRAGFVGFALVFLSGMALTIGFPTILLLIYPWMLGLRISNHILDTGPVAFDIFFAVASGLVSLGGVVFGIATNRARVFYRPLGTIFVVLSVASGILGFLSLPGGGGLPLSWWWGTTGTFGVVAYMVGLAWYGVELLLRVSAERSSQDPPATAEVWDPGGSSHSEVGMANLQSHKRQFIARSVAGHGR